MNQFLLQQGVAQELQLLPHSAEFALKKNNSIRRVSFPITPYGLIRIYFIIDGKFEWTFEHRQHILYPCDVAILLSNQQFGRSKAFLDLGTISWINIKIDKLDLFTGIICPYLKD